MKHSALLLAMVLSISTVASAAPIPQGSQRCLGSDRDWAYWGLQSGLSLAEIAELQKQSNGGKACKPGSETSLPYVRPNFPQPVVNQPPPPVTKPRPSKPKADEEHLPTLPDDEHKRALKNLEKKGFADWQAEAIIREALRESVGLKPIKLGFSITRPAKQKPTTTTTKGAKGGTPKVKSPRQDAIDRIVATGVSEKDAAAFVDAQLAKSKGTSTSKTKDKPTNTSGMSAADKKAWDELEKQKAQFLADAKAAGYSDEEAHAMLADALRKAEAQAKKEGK